MEEEYLINCWYCTMEYDLISAEWCKCDANQPTKVCPYCLKCFCQATDEYKEEIWSKAPESIKKERGSALMPKDKLGDLLISKGLLTTNQLLEALKVQKETKRKLGEVLTDLNYITQQEIVSALSDQFDLVNIELDMFKMPDPQIFRYISIDFCEKNLVAPIDLQQIGSKTILYIAVTSPPDKKIISKIHEITGFQVYPYIASKSSIIEYLSIVKERTEVKPRSINLIGSILKLLEEIIKKSIELDCNFIVFTKDKDKSCFVEMKCHSNIISKLQLNKPIFAQIREHLHDISNLPKDQEDKISDITALTSIDVSGSSQKYLVSFSNRDQGEQISLQRLTKKMFSIPIDDWNISEKDKADLKSNLLKPNGISYILGLSKMSNLSAMYSLHLRLIERSFNVLSLQDIIPFELDRIEYIGISDNRTADEIDILESFVKNDSISLERDPFTFFNDREYLYRLIHQKHIISIIEKDKIIDLFKDLYDNDLLDRYLLEKLNFIISLKSIRKICQNCRQPMNLNPRMLKALGLTDEEIPKVKAFKGAGCDNCSSTGFFGEIILYKIMDFSAQWKEDILSQPEFEIDTLNMVKQNLPPSQIRRIGFDFVNQGIITLSELLKNI